jgi:hypothetical protein
MKISDIKNLRPSDYPYPQLREVPSGDCIAMTCSASCSASWLPIAIAPKDGTRILITDGDMLEVCSWNQTRCLDYPGDMGWRYGTGDDYSTYQEIENPTHWMPLPSLPNAEVRHGAKDARKT